MKNTEKMKTFVSKLINFIYPPVCGICGRVNADFLCNKCEKLLEAQAKFQIESIDDADYFFEEHLYIFDYQGMIRKVLLNYKFFDRSYLYRTIVNFLLKNKKFFQILQSYDTIVPAPISKKRQKERGYNQSELIAKELASKLNLDYNNQCLLKVKNIVEQSKLNKEGRQKNIQGAYQLYDAQILQGKKILFLDDIYTTGSTANECCKTLREASPTKIGVLTIAKD